MQQIITAKLKLNTTPEEHRLFRQTQLAYRDALNYVSRYAFAHGKMSNAERLQKGTRSATRRLITLSGRERRLKLQANHSIAKSIIVSHPHTLIGLEELTGIRERTRRRKRRRKKHGKGTEPVSPKARRANRHASQWAFAELHSMLTWWEHGISRCERFLPGKTG